MCDFSFLWLASFGSLKLFYVYKNSSYEMILIKIKKCAVLFQKYLKHQFHNRTLSNSIHNPKMEQK